MIIEKIILHNFGIFSGRHEIDVSVSSKKRPIVLIGALNGAGKTTILDSLQLAFFGRNAHCSGREGISYKEYLKRSINNNGPLEEGAAVEIQFRRRHDGISENYEIFRAWHFKKGNLKETLRIIKNGRSNENLSKNWEDYVENILPSQIAPLFFFDGEKIKDLATPERSGNILKTALFGLLGLDLVETLKKDLLVFERRQKANLLTTQEKGKVKESENRFGELRKKKALVLKEIGANLDKGKNLGAVLSQDKNKLKTEGYDLFKSQEDLRSKEKELIDEIDTDRESLRELAANDAPLLLADKGLENLLVLAKKENEIKKALVLQKAMKNKNEKLLNYLETILSRAKVKDISKYLENEIGELELKTSNDVKANIPEKAEILVENVFSLKNGLINILKKQTTSLEQKKVKLMDLQRLLLSVPEEEKLRPLLEKIRQTENKINENDADQKSLEKKLHQINYQIDVVKREITRGYELAFDLIQQNENIARKLKHSKKARNKLDVFKDRIVKYHIEKIEKEITSKFNKLHRKNHFIKQIKIDPDNFELSLMNKQDKLVPMNRMSAGERQILAISILWALAKTSGVRMPIVIDTPLGRLDSEHRTTLLKKYFPYAGEQVILLSTDKEIIGKDKEKIEAHLAHSYLVEYLPKSQSSQIKKGYFGE